MAWNPDKAVAYALAQVGKAYRYGEVGPYAFDCSGLVMKALAAGGKTVDHNSGRQVSQTVHVQPTWANRLKLKPGDVVFWYGDIDVPESVTHCGLYIGRSKTGLFNCVAAVDRAHGVMKHRLNWALPPSGFGYVGHK